MFRTRSLAPPLLALTLVSVAISGGPASAATTELFFSEYIEGSSNNKALEIYNGTTASVDLATGGYNVQMHFNGNPVAGLTINLTGTVASGDVFVLAHSSANAAILAQADQTNGSGWFNGDDAVVLRKGTTVLDVIGQIGFDPGSEWGTGLTSTADNTLRRKATVLAGDPTGTDPFDPSIEWEGFPTDTSAGLGAHTVSSGGDTAPSVASTSPGADAINVAPDASIAITFSEPVNVTQPWSSVTCTSTGIHATTQSGGPVTFTLDPALDFALGETCTVTVTPGAVTDGDTDDPPDAMSTSFSFSFTVLGPTRRIHEVQGAAHLSPFRGAVVGNIPGVVTAVAPNGFYMQDPEPDADVNTSEGIFVFTSTAPSVSVGARVRVSGRVAEFRPGGSASGNLTTTEITSPLVTVDGTGTIAPTTIGIGGRIAPWMVIEDDSAGNVETSNTFDPAQDGIDFYESLEGMRVRINFAMAVGPRSAFGEIPVVADLGVLAPIRTFRGGVVIRPNDFNPERLILDDVIQPTPSVDVRDWFRQVQAVVDYSFGNYKLLVLNELAPVDGGLARETTQAAGRDELAVASFNVENLDAEDAPEKFGALAGLIVNNLRSPDLIAIEEIQDNNGPGSGTTDASATWGALILAIQAAGGPTYQHRQIDPVNNADGGEPDGNIRQGFLFRTDRGLAFVDRPGGTATNATHDDATQPGAQLTFSPGRIDPTNAAFASSRKPLVGEFTWRGETFFAIANHFNSKGGDDPLFGRFQPPVRGSEVQRHQQAQVVNSFVDALLAADARARVVVLGDLNDFEFSETLDILKGGVLVNLIETLPKPDRYSYVFEGNSQVLDQILVTTRLRGSFVAYDSVHVNAEFAAQDSDHDPQVARFRFGGRGRNDD